MTILRCVGGEVARVLHEFVRLIFAWGAMIGVVAFWYWLLANLGTF